MYANKPEIAARWEAETPKGAKLPNKVSSKHTKVKTVKNVKTI